MGSFSIWHWVVVAVFIVIPLALIASVGNDARLARGTFAVRLLSLIGVSIVLGLLSVLLPHPFGPFVGMLLLIVYLVGLWSFRWSAARFQDMGLSKWLTLLYMIPVANFLVLLWQCLAGAKDIGQPVYR